MSNEARPYDDEKGCSLGERRKRVAEPRSIVSSRGVRFVALRASRLLDYSSSKSVALGQPFSTAKRAGRHPSLLGTADGFFAVSKGKLGTGTRLMACKRYLDRMKTTVCVMGRIGLLTV